MLTVFFILTNYIIYHYKENIIIFSFLSHFSEFRSQAGKLCKAMIELEKDVKCYMERKNKWREALTKVANAKGIHLQYRFFFFPLLSHPLSLSLYIVFIANKIIGLFSIYHFLILTNIILKNIHINVKNMQ